MELLLWISLPLLLLGSVVCIFYYVLGSVRERYVSARAQFLLSDLLWLIVLMQMALAPLAATLTREEIARRGGVWRSSLLYLLVCLAVLAIWWGWVKALNRAGVCSTARRGVLIGVVLPLTLVLGIAVPIAVMVVFLSTVWTIFPTPTDDTGNFYSQLALATVLAAAPLLWVLRRMTLWAIHAPATKTERR